MVQDITVKFDNQYKNITPSDKDRVICVKDGKVLSSLKDDIISYPQVKDVLSVGNYLFTVGEERYFSGYAEESGEYSFYELRKIKTPLSKNEVFAGVSAMHLIRWYDNNKFCGKCSGRMHHSHNLRAMECECGNIVFPVISPAVIVAVTCNDRILLTKYNRSYAHWALVAGYTEIGETSEQTVEREVMEETGLRVKNIRYYKSQPWGLSSTLLSGFFCEADGSDEIILDNEELKEGRWFSRDEIDFENDDFSLTREMIDAFRQSLY